MIIKQVEVRGLNNFEQITLAIDFSQLDSLRLTAYLIKLMFENFGHGIEESFIKRLENDETFFVVSSPFFVEKEKYFLPINKSFVTFLKTKYRNIFEEKKEINYFPLIVKEKLNFHIQEEDLNVIFEHKTHRIKNVIDRSTNTSKNVYSIKTSIVKPFRFLIVYSDADKDKFNFINSLKATLGKRVSIGFGVSNFKLEQDFPNAFENRIEIEKVEAEKEYYLFNRLPILGEIIDKIDWNKSFYEIIKISGYLPSGNKRTLFCIKEGSIIIFKENYKLKNYIYKVSKKYILPIRPLLIKLQNG